MSLNSSSPTQLHLMNPTELHAMIARMDTYGGSFVSSIAQALRFADPKNRQRLLDAFPDLVQKYGPQGQFAQVKQLTQV
jgi:hypothetical protein